MSNRVEELESKVAELQAAVNGLTEELVETKERVRLLEEAVEVFARVVRQGRIEAGPLDLVAVSDGRDVSVLAAEGELAGVGAAVRRRLLRPPAEQLSKRTQHSWPKTSQVAIKGFPHGYQIE